MTSYMLKDLEPSSIVRLPGGKYGYIVLRSRRDKEVDILTLADDGESGEIISLRETVVVDLVLFPHELAKKYLKEVAREKAAKETA